MGADGDVSREGLRLTAPRHGAPSSLQLPHDMGIAACGPSHALPHSPRPVAANHECLRLTGREPSYRNPAESLILRHFGAGLLCSVSGVRRKRSQAVGGDARRSLRGFCGDPLHFIGVDLVPPAVFSSALAAIVGRSHTRPAANPITRARPGGAAH